MTLRSANLKSSFTNLTVEVHEPDAKVHEPEVEAQEPEVEVHEPEVEAPEPEVELTSLTLRFTSLTLSSADVTPSPADLTLMSADVALRPADVTFSFRILSNVDISGNTCAEAALFTVALAMSNADFGTASGTNVNDSRRDRVCSGRERRESWIRSYRRSRRAIVASRRLIDSSRRIIDSCERSAAEHPLRASRQLQGVWGRLGRALARLERGAEGLRETNERIARSPEYAGDAPALMIEAITRWAGAATTIVALFDQLDDDRAALLEYVKDAGACLDLDELFKSGGPAPRLITRRSLPATRFSERSRVFCIHVRRKRSARLTIAEAPKRIFRGRAPPPHSTCSL